MADPDFALLCAIREAPLDGMAAWARRVGQTESAGRRRLARLQESGALQGFTAIPAAPVFGRLYTSHRFDAPDGCDPKAILAIDDVAWFARTLDGSLYVITYEEPGGPARRGALEALLGPNVGTFEHAGQPRPEPLGRISLRVLRELIIDPRATIAQLAQRTGLSPKTVRGHRGELVAKRLVTIDPLLRTPTMPGRLFYNLSVHMEDMRHCDAIVAAIDDAVLINQFREPPAAYLFATAADLVEQGRHMQRIRRLPYVTDVRLIVNQEYEVAVARLVRWCDEAIAAWS